MRATCTRPSKMPPSHDIDAHKQADADSRFRRQNVQSQSAISKDGPFPPEKGRYIAPSFVSGASRTLIARSLKGLEDLTGISI
jgi:glutathionyl-hydroquinone reductase